MTRCRFLLTGALTAGAVFVPTTSALASTNLANLAAPACTDSWRAPVSGGWSDAADWTNGIPGEGGPVAACITVAGTYTVTLAPWSIGTADPNHQFAGITSLTLGAAGGPGKQTLVVLGQSSPNDSNEQVNTTGLSTTAPSLITANGRLVLNSTDGGEKAKGVPYGGDAVVTGGLFTNYGAITMTVQDANNKAANYTQFYSALTNEPKASVTDQSGLLDVNSVTNNGTLTVAPGASMDLAFQAPGSGYPNGVFTNSGTVTNSGAISAQAGTWSQLGGRVTGDAVVLQAASKLVDRSGEASFVVNSNSTELVGTVPRGQTITVVGGTYNYQGENYPSTTLGLGGTTVVNDGTIVVDAQGTKTTGGAAVLSDGTIDNNGNIVAEVTHSSWPVEWQQVALTNEVRGTITDRSGLLQVNSISNDGALTVAPGASLDVLPGALPNGVFTNSGTIDNGGTISAQGGTWSQLGGAVAGNAVALQDGTKLVDHAGAAKFVVNASSASLVGTVPKGQTITVVGEVYNYQGENYNSTTLGLGGTTVVNDGTIVVDAQGTKTTGGAAVLSDGTIDNNGNIVAEVTHSSWTVNWQIGLANNEAGKVTVTGGTLNESGGGSDANAGTVTVAPGAAWLLQGGSAFTNQRGGSIVPEIAGPSSIGQFELADVVNAGGALVPALVGGYTPPANKEFPVFELEGGKLVGKFSSVKAPFSADYTHETSTPAFVGVIYKSTKLKTAKISRRFGNAAQR
jgi:hypothetical protein